MDKIKASSQLTNGNELSLGSFPPVHTLAQPCQSTTLQKRARSKFYSLPLAKSLAEHAKSVGDSRMEHSYRNTFFCTDTIVQENGKLTTRFCGNRWCNVCNRIRAGRAINVYKPVVESWGEDCWMVTLTLPNVPEGKLCATFDAMRKGFASCLRSIRRTEGLEVVAVRKTECTYNFETNTYHPHYHVLIRGEAQAMLLREIWLRRFNGGVDRKKRPVPRADFKGQDVRLCDDDSLKELFKYFTKLSAKESDKTKRPIPVSALHIIFHAMRGRRVWQPCGFTLPKEVEESIEGEVIEVEPLEATKRPDDRAYWQWDQRLTDWVDTKTGELLSGYVPSDRFRAKVDAIGETYRTLSEGSQPAGP